MPSHVGPVIPDAKADASKPKHAAAIMTMSSRTTLTCTTAESSSMTTTSAFDKSCYVVVRPSCNNSRQAQRHRRRTGSFGEAPAQLTQAVNTPTTEWDFDANFNHAEPVQDHTVVMMEPYTHPLAGEQNKRALTGKDFMDGSDFLHSSNVFRDAHTSQRWHSDVMEKPSCSFDEQHDLHGMEKLVQELCIHLYEKQHDENTKPLNPAFVKDSNNDTAPTTLTTEPTMTPPSSLKKRNRKHKKKKRHSRLPSVVPPDHVMIEHDSETVASSVGGLTAFQCQEKIQTLLTKGRYTVHDDDDGDGVPTQALHTTKQTTAKARGGTPRQVDISAPMTVASSVGQDSGWVMKCTTPPSRTTRRRQPREIDISAPMTVQSSLGDGEESFVLFRARKPLDLEKVTRSTMEIQVPTAGEHTVVSSLGESMGDRRGYRPLSNHVNVVPSRDSTFHQLYRSNDGRD